MIDPTLTFLCCSIITTTLLLLLQQCQLPSFVEGAATHNLSVSFDALSANPVTLPEYGGMKAYVAFSTSGTHNSNDMAPEAWLLFIPAAAAPSSVAAFVLSVLVYVHFGDSAAAPDSQRAVVWMANRHNPVSGNFSLSLDQISGHLKLRDGDGSLAWSSNSTTKAQGLVSMDFVTDATNFYAAAGGLLPVGTLMLFDAQNNSLWQSSDHPSHTLMSSQLLQPGMSLISWASASDPLEGLYSLEMEAGGLALYYNAFNSRRPYWIWSYYDHNDTFGISHTCSNLTTAYMDPVGGLRLLKGNEIAAHNVRWPDLCSAQSDNDDSESHEVPFSNFVSGGGMVTFLLQYDGNLFVNSLDASLVRVLDLFSDNRCLLPNYCGPYGICTGPGNCECPGNGSFLSAFPSNSSEGCLPIRSLTCPNNQTTQFQQQFLVLKGVDYFSNKYSSPLNFSTQEACTHQCLQNCSCLAVFWHVHSSSCFHLDHMSSLQGGLNYSYLAFLKVVASTPASPSKQRAAPSRLIAGLVSGVVAILITLSILAASLQRKLRMAEDVESEEEEPIWDSIAGFPNRYSYKDLHSITGGFSEQMGKGGFGAVYAGILPDGTRVAVKRLESLRQGKKEFKAEVVILGGIHHYNLVGLIGFCAQGPQKLLVYEYMANGSLDHWLFTTGTPPLHWKHRFNIALGAARGLAYLHGECSHTIIHLDIKPQNILLDEDFVAKLSDFGLSTLIRRDETHKVTAMRGTPGYLAPEWLSETFTLSEKCDVFSFGKLLMEILGGRRNLDPSFADTDIKQYFPSWLYQRVVRDGREAELFHMARVNTPEEMRQARLMMKSAFLCVVDNPDQRPSMKSVVRMLEGGAPELEHLQLSDYLQDLQFALRMQSAELAQAKIEKTLAPVYQSQAGFMSLHVSAR